MRISNRSTKQAASHLETIASAPTHVENLPEIKKDPAKTYSQPTHTPLRIYSYCLLLE